MNGWWDDIRSAFRTLIKKPAFFVIASLTLAFGIGASASIFSIVDTVLLKPLPFQQPDRIASFYAYYSQMSMRGAFSPPTLVDFRRHLESFQSLAATAPWNANLTGFGEPRRIEALLVASNFFETIGASPQLGRSFLPEEEQPGKENVVIISNRLWKTQFGGRDLLGESLYLNGVPYEVVGIMPPGFQWGRRYGRDATAELWAPFALTEQRIAESQRGSEFLDLVGRLKDGRTLPSAESEVIRLCEKLHQDYPSHYQLDNGWILRLKSLQEEMVAGVRPMILVLFAAVGLLLLIACSNVTNLLLARGTERHREIAVRFALGASRFQIIRQLLTESILLSLTGGILGFFLAIWSIEGVAVLQAAGIPRLNEVGLDWRLLCFAIAVSILTGFLFGIFPALRVTKSTLYESLKEGGRSGTSGVQHRKVRDGLVVLQISISLMLLVGAVLLIHSFQKILTVHPGFQTDHLLTLKVTLSAQRYPEFSQRITYFERVLDRIRSMPETLNAAAISILPMGNDANSSSFEIEGRISDPGTQEPVGEMWVVTPDYFQAMNIPVVSGRSFLSQDSENAIPVVIIDQVLANRFWPNEDPIGKRIDFEGSYDKRKWREIVGVVGQVKQRNLEDIARPQFYVPYSQYPLRMMGLVVRTQQNPASAASSIRKAAYAVDADQPMYEVHTMDELISDSLAQRRLAILLLGSFAVVALFLAGIGLYGVLSVSVTGRRQEFSIRMMLGAERRDVLVMVLLHTLKLTGIGISMGAIGAFLVANKVSTLFYETSPSDFGAFVTVVLLMTLVALMASYLPIRRALGVHPSEALRYE